MAPASEADRLIARSAGRGWGGRRARRAWRDGWLRGAQWIASPNHGARPPRAEVTLAVVHSISLPPGVYGGDAVERLFTNRLDPRAHPSFAEVHALRVSAHFVIRRDGRLQQYVSCDRRAWHAGVSAWRGRENCNDVSIGIELEGLEGRPFEDAQYAQLLRLLRDLRRRYPLRDLVGHEHVAPGRKRDPGPGFRGPEVLQACGLQGPEAWTATVRDRSDGLRVSDVGVDPGRLIAH
ncbi:MAG: 1,6-anhydro-N-acetylmuramyl-L-alanine amidase AmpD [Ideonella sp.]|jgi:AmpD protein|nr:1,6-anhydro-N-acetylmuramyl-L-alanine amidase AmpD [Ideonella sp.]